MKVRFKRQDGEQKESGIQDQAQADERAAKEPSKWTDAGTLDSCMHRWSWPSVDQSLTNG